VHEEDLVRAILARIGDRIGAAADGILVGPGDDAAVLLPRAGAAIVVTTDALVEGVHFDLAFSSAEDVGHKLVESNFSDLAAMGATPRWLLVALQTPRGGGAISLAAVEAAIARCAHRGVRVVGGNVAEGPTIALTATALGEVEGAPLRRSGARPDEGVWISGPTGLAAAGLAALRAGRGADALFAEAVGRHRRPEARISHGRAAARFATAGIDVSDGLALDLDRLCEASGIGAQVRLARVPSSSRLADLARALGEDENRLLASGGEDYEIVVTVPSASSAEAEAAGFVRIGETRTAPGVRLERTDGGLYDGPRGWIHST